VHKGRTLGELFFNRRYAIDTYQREYKWQTKQLVELIDDLCGKFLEYYEPDHDRDAVVKYGHYFLGSIILSQKKGQSYIIDGQQRLTTLTLFLIYLHHRQRELPEEGRVPVDHLILSTTYGKKSFNIDSTPSIPGSLTWRAYEHINPMSKDPEAVRNMVARYKEIQDNFPPDINDQALPFFLDWLLTNVHVVEITAYSDDDAYTIFETMNDRGLSSRRWTCSRVSSLPTSPPKPSETASTPSGNKPPTAYSNSTRRNPPTPFRYYANAWTK